jgi:hypothetical protein
MDEEQAVSGRTACVGDAGGDLRHLCCRNRGYPGEGGGESRTRVSSSEILLARRPKPLGGRMSGEGGDGERLGERGQGTLEMCSMALLEEKVPLLRKWNLEAREDTRWRMERDTEDWEVEEIVDGECLRLGAGSLTTFGESADLRMKEGMGMTVLYVLGRGEGVTAKKEK